VPVRPRQVVYQDGDKLGKKSGNIAKSVYHASEVV